MRKKTARRVLYSLLPSVRNGRWVLDRYTHRVWNPLTDALEVSVSFDLTDFRLYSPVLSVSLCYEYDLTVTAKVPERVGEKGFLIADPASISRFHKLIRKIAVEETRGCSPSKRLRRT